jgi:anti-sigma regulatory factor (Ser/Thr protein kinase)
MVDPVGRITQATGQPAERLELPGYPLGDVQPDLWRRPPDPPREARIRLPPEAASVPALRGLLGRLLHSWRLDDLARSGDVALLATEVATNAIRHAGTPLTVLVCYLGPALRVEVGDSSPVVPVARPAPPEELGGRGLLILEALARDWGVIRTRTGKRVWFEVDVTKDVPSAGGDQRRRT